MVGRGVIGRFNIAPVRMLDPALGVNISRVVNTGSSLVASPVSSMPIEYYPVGTGKEFPSVCSVADKASLNSLLTRREATKAAFDRQMTDLLASHSRAVKQVQDLYYKDVTALDVQIQEFVASHPGCTVEEAKRLKLVH